MEKDFENWNKAKQKLETRVIDAFAHPREIWRCSLGINIGAEIDGKNENFERTVIVMKAYNKETMFVLPITSKQKDDKFHRRIQTDQKTVWVKLTQPRVISNKRLLRKVDILGEDEFEALRNAWRETVQKQIGLRISAEPSEAEALISIIYTKRIKIAIGKKDF